MRTNLKIFRVGKHLTQEQIAKILGVTRNCYASIESGKRNTKQAFWDNLQLKFNVPDAEMWQLTVNDKEGDNEQPH